MRHQRRFIYETSDEYVSALSDICHAIKACDNIKLIIKTRQQDYELNLETLIQLLSPLPKNAIIDIQKSIKGNFHQSFCIENRITA